MHSVMSIFTFVGNTLSQQDDSYSFQVISKVIDTLLPALFKVKQPVTHQVFKKKIFSLVLFVCCLDCWLYCI